MNNPLNNLCPFYVGQTVAAVVDHSAGSFHKGQQFTVLAIKRRACKCTGWLVDVGIRLEYDNSKCTKCNGLRPYDAFYCASAFAPLQQSKFPLMSFTSIKEKEEKQILIEN